MLKYDKKVHFYADTVRRRHWNYSCMRAQKRKNRD